MLATFGLERLESGLDRDTVSATDVAEFLQQAQADDVRTLARDGMPKRWMACIAASTNAIPRRGCRAHITVMMAGFANAALCVQRRQY